MAVAHDRTAYAEAVGRYLPTGDAWPREPGSPLHRLTDWIGAELARVDQRVQDLLREADPRQATEMLPDWEVETGLPDACAPADLPIASRRAAVVGRLTEMRSPTKAAFIALAAAYGVDAAITEHHAHTTEHDTEDAITDEPWAFVWDMLAPDVVVLECTSEDTTETPLEVWPVGPHECAVRRMAPAHTLVRFGTYQADWDFRAGLPAGATLTRPDPATHIDAEGALVEDAADAARFDYDPTREMNLIGDAAWFGGAEAGSPGTAPPGWTLTGSVAGLTRTIVGFGEEDGIPYLDVHWGGTADSGVNLDLAGPLVPAAAGDQMAGTVCVRRRAGAMPAQIQVRIAEYQDSTPLSVGASSYYTVTAGALAGQVRPHVRTLTEAATTRARLVARILVLGGTAVSFTIRYGFPTLAKAPAPITDRVPLVTLAQRSGTVPQYALRGMLVEGDGSNGGRNPRLEGGAVGTPGTPPTGLVMTGMSDGLSREILAFGVEDGIDVMDVRCWGTTTAAVNFEVYWTTIAQAQPVALGEVWSAWFRWRLLAGSIAGATFSGLRLWHFNAGGSGTIYLQQSAVPTGAPLRAQPVALTWQVTDPDAARASHRMRMLFPAGVTVDFTIRVGGAQIQPGAGGSDILPPVGTVDVSTRGEDALTLDVPDGGYEVEAIAGTLNSAGTRYLGAGTAAYGQGLRFAWPAAATAAGERHLQSLHLRKVS